jgi:hypothetical protein
MSWADSNDIREARCDAIRARFARLLGGEELAPGELATLMEDTAEFMAENPDDTEDWIATEPQYATAFGGPDDGSQLRIGESVWERREGGAYRLRWNPDTDVLFWLWVPHAG